MYPRGDPLGRSAAQKVRHKLAVAERKKISDQKAEKAKHLKEAEAKERKQQHLASTRAWVVSLALREPAVREIKHSSPVDFELIKLIFDAYKKLSDLREGESRLGAAIRAAHEQTNWTYKNTRAGEECVNIAADAIRAGRDNIKNRPKKK